MKLLCWLTLVAVVPVHAQRVITVDWSDKSLTNTPTKVDAPMPVKLRVVKVNDFLYTYESKIKYEPKAAESISLDDIVKLVGVASDACSAIDGHANKVKDLAKPFVLEADRDGAYPSRPLKDSQQDWDRLEPEYQAMENATADEQKCESHKLYIKTLQPKLRALAKVSKGDHEFITDHILPGDGEYTIEIKEFYEKKVTTGGAYTAKFYAASSVFFLSAGYLGSQVQSRTYDSVDVATGRKELRIQGSGSWRPNVALLLNYQLPISKLTGEKMGLAISAGPVYRAISSQSGNTATNLGVFAGLSLHLWTRVVLTPGFHLGEFADMPLGFDNNHDRTIPAGIANPITGVNRWTTRFGIGITFAIADFKKAASATLSQNTSAAAKTPAGSTAVDRSKAEEAVRSAEAAVTKSQEDLKKAQADFDTKEAARVKADQAFNAETDATKQAALKTALETANKEATAAGAARKTAEAALEAAKKKLVAAKAALEKLP